MTARRAPLPPLPPVICARNDARHGWVAAYHGRFMGWIDREPGGYRVRTLVGPGGAARTPQRAAEAAVAAWHRVYGEEARPR